MLLAGEKKLQCLLVLITTFPIQCISDRQIQFSQIPVHTRTRWKRRTEPKTEEQHFRDYLEKLFVLKTRYLEM